MAAFDNSWYDPTDTTGDGINGGKQWSPYSDALSVYDMNKIISDLIYLKNKVDELEARNNG